jgi:hypothetical protein
MKRQLLGIVAGVSAFFIAAGVNAEEKVLLEWSDDAAVLKKEWSGKIKYEKIDEKLCGVTEDKSYIISRKFFPVEAGKKYTLSGTFKSMGEEKSKVYYGFMTYDNKKRYIATYHSNIVAGSATVLAQPCKKGDKTLVVKANGKWKNRTVNAVAFNAKDDLSDLPNREIAYRIIKVTPKEDNMEIELSSSVKKAYPADTKVRAHTHAYGSYLYTTICGLTLGVNWKTFDGTATLAAPGKMSHKLFRPGTAFVKVLLMPNYSKKKDAKMAFKDLTLKVAE